MSKKITLSALIIASSAMFAAPQAMARDVEEMFSQCGIGAAIFKENATAAIISNITWDSGTTAVSSGFADSGCNKTDVEAASLVYKKFASIEAETVSGSGQHLAALMDIYQCNTESQKTVLRGVRQDFAGMLNADANYNSATQLDKAQSYYKILDQNVSRSCVI